MVSLFLAGGTNPVAKRDTFLGIGYILNIPAIFTNLPHNFTSIVVNDKSEVVILAQVQHQECEEYTFR